MGGGDSIIIKNLNNTLSAAGTKDKHNYLNIKVYPEGQKGVA